MNLTLERHHLKAAVAGFGRIVPNRPALPILNAVRFSRHNRTVQLTATDLEQTAAYEVEDATGDGDGTFVLPYQALRQFTRGRDPEPVRFACNGSGPAVTVEHDVAGHAVRFPVTGLDPADWPETSMATTTSPATGFLETYRRLARFCSTDTSRYLLNGIYVEVAPKGLHPVTMVATDGRRLCSQNTLQLPIQHSLIVPVTRFLRWTGLDGAVEMGLRTQRVKRDVNVLGLTVRAGNWRYDVRAIDGTYPAFRQVIPNHGGTASRLAFTDEDVEALRQVLPGFPAADTPHAVITLRQQADGRVVVAGRGPDPENETVLALTGSRMEGGTQQVSLNARFLLDALETGFRDFTFADDESPLSSVDGKGGVHVLMPVRMGCSTPVVPATEPGAEPVAEVPVTAKPATAKPATAEPATATTPTAVQTNETKPNDPTQGERMKETNEQQTPPDGTALDKVLAAVETARGKLRESATALADVTDAVKTALKEGKAQAADLEKARTTLQKLQAISL